MKNSQVKRINQVLGSIIQLFISVIFIAVSVWLIYKGMTLSYQFGYSIFNEEPVASSNGTVTEYTVDDGDSIFDIAQELEKMGLIRDAKVMIVDKYIYQYTIYPGTYSLSTSMTSKDMLERIGTAPEETEEE